MKKTSYKLEIESGLWRKFKVKCTQEGLTMISVITRLIKSYVEGKISEKAP